jgi:hypothetical protein
LIRQLSRIAISSAKHGKPDCPELAGVSKTLQAREEDREIRLDCRIHPDGDAQFWTGPLWIFSASRDYEAAHAGLDLPGF